MWSKYLHLLLTNVYSVPFRCLAFGPCLQQGLIDFAFSPLFGVTGFPSYFYLSYTVQLDDGVS